MRLGELQLRILQVLWRSGSSTVAQVQEALGGRDLAYTTVATMLRKMEERSLVRHAVEGRRFLYHAAVSETEVRRSMSDDLVDRVFEGSLAQAVSHLLETREVDAGELDRLEQLIQQRKTLRESNRKGRK